MRVCPWWLGFFLLNPLRRWVQDPRKILESHVKAGMTVLEPGPGMGFFTLELARRVGPYGKVVVVDVQDKMLKVLRRRVAKKCFSERVEARLIQGDDLGVGDLEQKIDFVLAFAMIHEVPNARKFFENLYASLKINAKVLVAEPKGHVTENDFAVTCNTAKDTGFIVEEGPPIWKSRTAIFVKA